MIVSMILSGLALLAAIVCLVMIYREKKRSAKQNAALIRFVEGEAKAVSTASGIYADGEIKRVLDRMNNFGGTVAGEAKAYTNEKFQECAERIEKLERGIAPDYEAAKQAADAVNDFSKGITNILGFDPMEALKADRQKGTGDFE